MNNNFAHVIQRSFITEHKNLLCFCIKNWMNFQTKREKTVTKGVCNICESMRHRARHTTRKLPSLYFYWISLHSQSSVSGVDSFLGNLFLLAFVWWTLLAPPENSWNYAPVYWLNSFHNCTFLFFFLIYRFFFFQGSVSFYYFRYFRFKRLSMVLEDISHVLQPQFYRSSWAPDFSEDPSGCVSVSSWVSGSSTNLKATKASGGCISDSKDHKQKHSNRLKQSVGVNIER